MPASSLQTDANLSTSHRAAAAANRTGIVLPPDAESADTAIDQLFKAEFGREPNREDNTAVRDRDKESDPEVSTATEMGDEEEPLEPTPSDEPIKEVVTPDAPSIAKKDDVAPKEPTPPAEEDILDQLLPKTPAEPKADDKPADAPAEDPYAQHKLHQNASEKTRTTFEELKRTAREREEKARAEVTTLKETVQRLQTEMEQLKANPVAKEVVPENVQAELKELREFRATFAVERDPEFNRKFEERRGENTKAIADILKRNGLKDEVLEQLKAMPYEQQVEQISRWAERLSPRDKLALQAKLVDNETVESERSKALQEAKAKADEILAKQKEAPARSQEQYVQEVIAVLKPILPRVPILQPKTVADNASPKEKAEAEEHNKLVIRNGQLLVGFLQDDSPKTRGTLALSAILAPHYRAQLQKTEARVAELEKELADIRSAGRLSRTTQSSATAAGVAPKVDIFDTDADTAMEQAWKAMQGQG